MDQRSADIFGLAGSKEFDFEVQEKDRKLREERGDQKQAERRAEKELRMVRANEKALNKGRELAQHHKDEKKPSVEKKEDKKSKNKKLKEESPVRQLNINELLTK